MRVIVATFVIAAVVAAVAARQTPLRPTSPMVNDQRIIDAVNKDGRLPWVAGHNEAFEGWTVDDAKRLMGTRKPMETGRRYGPLMPPTVSSPPSSFDPRKKWPNCIHPILNQGQCGSCWAFAASEALSDRFCIDSNGTTNVVLSPQDLVSCDSGSYGCNGGFINQAWQYMEQSGIVTMACDPYQSGGGSSPSCPSSCQDGSPFKKYHAKSAYAVPAGSMTAELFERGPIECGFTVYQDFMNYKSGVYSHQYGSALGGHAVKVIGYGTENGVDYWLVANSWGPSWGLSGFFKIKRGVDECGIEDDCWAGLAAV